ncbi:MAG: hypothetical protein ABIG66_01120 [Candidatus Kerfeldbacteria bacterium]
MILFIASATNVAADSDWTISGSDMYSAVSGNVGIGNSSPAKKLDIDSGGTNIGMRLQSTDSMSYMSFQDNSTTSDSYVVLGAIGNDMQLKAGNAERIRIASTGNVGIGTTSPASMLHINSGTTNIGLRLHSEDALAGITFIDNSTTDSGYVSLGASGDDMYLIAGNSERMRLASDGKVGIGTTSPAQLLHVAGDLKIEDILYGPNSGDLTLQSTSSDNIIFNTDGNNERMRITDSGAVLINEDEIIDCEDESIPPKWQCKNSKLYVIKNSTPSDETAIRGIANSGSANPFGIWGIANATGALLGQPVGVRGDAINDDPTDGQVGVMGFNWATTQDANTFGAGVWGGSIGDPDGSGQFSGRGHGVMGETYSSAEGSSGIWGSALATSGSPTYGVYGEAKSNATGTSGVAGIAQATTGVIYGVYGREDSSNGSAYAIFADGDIGATGEKPAVVYTQTQGPTKLYAVESTQLWFEDLGEARLENGHAHINIDPLFLDTVTIDQENPIQVTITLYDDIGSNSVYVTRGITSFEVTESNNGGSDAAFSYRISAKRRFYENVRLEASEVPITDIMRPDLSRAEISQLNLQWQRPDNWDWYRTAYQSYSEARQN